MLVLVFVCVYERGGGLKANQIIVGREARASFIDARNRDGDDDDIGDQRRLSESAPRV